VNWDLSRKIAPQQSAVSRQLANPRYIPYFLALFQYLVRVVLKVVLILQVDSDLGRSSMATSEGIAGFPTLSTTSEVIFNTKGRISRWSNTEVSSAGCAAIVVPSTEGDIVAVVKFSAQNGLRVLPTAGKHGSFVPINKRSVYLDLKNFDNIELDEESGSVKIGGGVTTGQLCSVLAAKGWYTSRLDISPLL
jgi:hypothetical protein